MYKNCLSKLLPVLIIIWGLCACAQEKAQNQDNPGGNSIPAITHLSVEDVYQTIQDNPDAVIIDVRTAQEFTGPLGHINNALLKPIQDIQTWASQLDSLKSRQIIFVCRSGGRSSRASEYFVKQGFSNIINMKGGMMAWNEKGYETE